MKIYLILSLIISNAVIANSSWVKQIGDEDKQHQLDLRWNAYAGEVDIQFAINKLKSMKIDINTAPSFSKNNLNQDHLVFPINNKPYLELQAPYGSIDKVTNGQLHINADFAIVYKNKIIQVSLLKIIPTKQNINDYDFATFKLVDQANRHLFTTNNIHMNYDKNKKLLHLNNMDLLASSQLAQELGFPELKNQFIGGMDTYSKLDIPETALFDIKGGNCLSNPNFQNGQGVDVELATIGDIQFTDYVNSTNNLVITPSAELFNAGTADVPWYLKFTPDSPPYDNDQHPFLTWAVYREVDNRFEQIGLSGVKHAFYSTNILCNCPGGNVLGVGCGDVYGVGNNNQNNALGPRDEISAFQGLWENCNSFFDPNCTGNQTVQSGNANTGENRLTLAPEDIGPNLIMQAWYLIRDDVNIFNSMGYRKFSPSFSNNSWSMNPEPISNFNNGAALDNYVTPNTITESESSQTIQSNEGHYTVAVKVVELGNGLFRYNYAIENYDFDPKFKQYTLPLPEDATLSDTLFVDPDKNQSNDWTFNRAGDSLKVTGNLENQQDWGMLFSFSFTTDSAPELNEVTIHASQVNLNDRVSATAITPKKIDLIFIGGFELVD